MSETPNEAEIVASVTPFFTDPYYKEDITANQLIEELASNPDPKATRAYFNNLPLHIIDPYLVTHDELKFRQDFDESMTTSLQKYWDKEEDFAESLLKSQRTMSVSKDHWLVIADIYISMRKKGYPRYEQDCKKPCLIR